MTTQNSDKRCATCDKGENKLTNPLKIYAKCKTVQACATTSSGTATIPRPRFEIERPFTALRDGNWLSSRPEQDVYQLVSDVFRMRREDQYKFEGEVDEGSVYAGGSASTELQNYRRFLKSVTELDEKREPNKKLLPKWWPADKLEECVKVARTKKDAMVADAVEKSGIQEFYKQTDMPMQLRMSGEALDGTKVMGQSGASFLQMQIAVENGGLYSSHIELSQLQH